MIMCNRGDGEQTLRFGSWGGNSSAPRALPRGTHFREAARGNGRGKQWMLEDTKWKEL